MSNSQPGGSPGDLLNADDRTALAQLRDRLWARLYEDIQSDVLRPRDMGRPHMLWHYTDVAGALGIIKSQKIWATNILFMNDPLELLRVFKRLTEVADNFLSNSPNDSVWRRVRQQIKDEPDFVTDGEPSILFVASFTTHASSPNHWALYSDRGRGVALGFLTSEIGTASLRTKTPLVPCAYDDGELSNFVTEVLTVSEARLRIAAERHTGIALAAFDKQFADEIGSTVAVLAPRYKAEPFGHEMEWRATMAVMNRDWGTVVKHRPVGDLIKPYVELDLTVANASVYWRLPITEIVLGPSANVELLRPGLRSALRAAGYEAEKIRIERTALHLRPSST